MSPPSRATSRACLPEPPPTECPPGRADVSTSSYQPTGHGVTRAEGWWDSATLADGLEQAAARRPDAQAVTDTEASMTYGELARSVTTGIATLDRANVGANDAAILVVGNTVAAVVAYHALLRTRATTLLLDRRCGAADLRFALDVLPDRADHHFGEGA